MMVIGAENILPFMQVHGYPFIFLLMLIEGPIVTYFVAFAASLGILNVYSVLLLSMLGNVVPDTLAYFLGRFSRVPRVERFLAYFGLNESKMKTLEERLKRHAGKSIVFIKLTPGIPIPGIILTGFMKVPLKKFLSVTLIFNFIATITFTSIGYFLGITVSTFLKYLKLEGFIFPILFVLGIILYFVIMFVYKKIQKSFNNN